MQEGHTKESLRGVSVVDEKTVWVSGTHGTYLVTFDGGNTWTPHQVPGAESLDFRGVKAFGAEVFLLAAGPGEQSRIYHTRDSSNNWELQFTNHEAEGFLDCVAFSDPAHGFVVGDPVSGKFQILHTEDGGKNWRYADSSGMPPAIEGEGAFAASNSCIAMNGKQNVWFVTGGTAARVFHSKDGGTSWTVVNTPIVHGTPSQGIFSVVFRDTWHGVIGGGDYAHPEQGGTNVATTEDGGKSWTSASIQPQKYFSAVSYISDHASTSFILVVGSSVSALSHGDLHSWKFFGPAGFNAIGSFGTTVYAVGPNGAIAKLVRK